MTQEEIQSEIQQLYKTIIDSQNRIMELQCILTEVCTHEKTKIIDNREICCICNKMIRYREEI